MACGVYTLLLLSALGCIAWGKAVGPIGPEEVIGAKEKTELKKPTEELELELADTAVNPCFYKGKIFTIDVRKIASMFK